MDPETERERALSNGRREKLTFWRSEGASSPKSNDRRWYPLCAHSLPLLLPAFLDIGQDNGGNCGGEI